MGKAPTLKKKARALARRQSAMQLLAKGKAISDISQELGVTTRQVRLYLTAALETESLYPSSLTPEKVSELRQVQAEVLSNSRQRAIETHAVVVARIGTAKEKNTDAMASARLLESVTRAVDLESALFGTKQPTRFVEESLRLQVTKSEQKVTISWDQNLLAAPADPVPGLFIGGRTHNNALPPATEIAANGN
jgi:predicted transcriptional regulator